MAFWELGLGRERVLSPEGRAEARRALVRRRARPHRADRRAGTGPLRELRLLPADGRHPAGRLRRLRNEWSPSDGQVVSLDHGCGAHSQGGVAVDPPQAELPILDELGYDALLLPD